MADFITEDTEDSVARTLCTARNKGNPCRVTAFGQCDCGQWSKMKMLALAAVDTANAGAFHKMPEADGSDLHEWVTRAMTTDPIAVVQIIAYFVQRLYEMRFAKNDVE